jgi:hypothetical protein
LRIRDDLTEDSQGALSSKDSIIARKVLIKDAKLRTFITEDVRLRFK